MNTYWQKFPRGFANEYQIGVATTTEDAEQYKAEGYQRVNRNTALRELCARGDNATQVYVGATLDSAPVHDRFEFARELRYRARI